MNKARFPGRSLNNNKHPKREVSYRNLVSSSTPSSSSSSMVGVGGAASNSPAAAGPSPDWKETMALLRAELPSLREQFGIQVVEEDKV
jgi:hypothetical protein